MATGPGWTRLGREVTSRRIKLGMRSQRALSDKAGVTERVIWKIERGLSVSRGSLAAVDAALGWPPGSSQDIAAGTEPPGTASSPASQEPAAPPDIVRDNWDDPVVSGIWGKDKIGPAAREGLISYYIALRDAAEQSKTA